MVWIVAQGVFGLLGEFSNPTHCQCNDFGAIRAHVPVRPVTLKGRRDNQQSLLIIEGLWIKHRNRMDHADGWKVNQVAS